MRADPLKNNRAVNVSYHRVKIAIPGGLRRYSVAHFLGALVLLLAMLPFLDQLRRGPIIESVLLTMVLLSAVLAVGGRRNTLIGGCILVFPAVMSRWIDHIFRNSDTGILTTSAEVIFLLFVMVHMFLYILRAPRVNSEVLCAGVSGYLLLGILWGLGFRLLERLSPGSFSYSGAAAGGSMDGFNCIYFSFVSLTTLGFGEIVPVSRVARMLTQGEAVAGMFYLAILISRLVALHTSNDAAS